MELRAAALRHLSVGDVAHQDVLERVLVVAATVETSWCSDEVAPLELCEPGRGIVAAVAVLRRRGARRRPPRRRRR